MKKRIGLILLALVLVFSLAACGAAEGTPEERAFAAYMTWVELIGADVENPVGAWDSDFAMEMDMRVFGITLHTFTTGVSQAIVDGDHITMYMDMNMDMGVPGVPIINMEMYIEMDGFTLIDMVMLSDGYYIPGVMDEVDDALSALEAIEDVNQVPDFVLDDIVTVEMEEGEGYTIFTITVDRDAVADFMDESMEQAFDMLDEFGFVDLNFGAEDFVLILTMDDEGMPIAVTMDMQMDITFDEDFEDTEFAGETFFVSYSITYTYRAFGDDVVIVRPEGIELPEPELPSASNELDALLEMEEILLNLDFDNLDLPEYFVGTWSWDANPDYTYIFHDDGIGFRGFAGALEEFDWVVEGDDHLLIMLLDTYALESWSFTIVDGVLTIDSRQIPGRTWSYIFEG